MLCLQEVAPIAVAQDTQKHPVARHALQGVGQMRGGVLLEVPAYAIRAIRRTLARIGG